MSRLATSLLLATAVTGFALEPVKINDAEAGLRATVFTYPEDQNHGFGILDLPDKSTAGPIKKHFDPAKHQLMINGGYFNPDWSPTGYCKIDGKVIAPKVNRGLSGFIAIDKAGKISLLTRGADLTKFPTVLQSGPHVIDPGGKIGIRSKTGRAAKRTLIGITTDKKIVVVITKPIYLIDLATSIQKHIPKLDRLLNLDGGPSTGVMGGGESTPNLTAVRNYLYKKRE